MTAGSTRRRTEGSRRGAKHRPHVAIVEGTQHGVPFRTYYKRMCDAERDAIDTGGTLIDLCTLRRRVAVKRYHAGGTLMEVIWRDA